ncbi:MAG: DUF697 domain-containing protein [Magnetococcales bacterium]|nr:DUF697 domain-containing protein [Magnetococcales bacterium]
MSAQVKWEPPALFTVDRSDSSPVSTRETEPNITPLLLSGELQDGDDIIDDPAAPVEIADSWMEEGPKKQRKGVFNWFITLSLLFLTAVVVQDTVLFLTEQFARSLVLGLAFALLAGGAGLALLILAFKEVVSLRSVKKVHNLQKQSRKLYRENSHGNGIRFSSGIMKLYKSRKDLDSGWQKFQDSTDSNFSDREVLSLFSNSVLIDLDKKAYGIVVNNSSVAALLTAISPMAWLDALLFFWRNVRMVRQIAICYGFRPGFIGSIVLIQEVLQGVVASATADFITDEVADSVGSSVTAVLFAKAGQGMANGLLSARVGVQAMRLCRPVVFLPNENPSLKLVRAEMIKQVKNRLG